MGLNSKAIVSVLVIAETIFSLSGCSSSQSPNAFPTVSMASTGSGVQINPTVEALSAGAQVQFSASGGTPPYSYAISSGGGSIDPSSGLYTAPESTGTAEVSVSDATGISSSATVTIGSGGTSNTLTLNPDQQTIAPGETLQFSVSGGTAPYTFSIISGGGTVNSQTGLYTAPSTASTVEVEVTDSSTPTQQIADSVITVGSPASSTSGSSGPTTLYPMGAAQSNDTLSGWPATNATDGNPATAYSSNSFASSTNTRGTFLAAWLLTPETTPENVSYVILTARMSNGKPLGFPQSYTISLTDPSNTTWNAVGSFTTQPDPSTGVATVALPSVYSTLGVMITPETLGQDNQGNYYFQLAEVQLGN